MMIMIVIPHEFIGHIIIHPICSLKIEKSDLSLVSSPLLLVTVIIPLAFTINKIAIIAMTSDNNDQSRDSHYELIVFCFLLVFFFSSTTFWMDIDAFISCYFT